MNSQTNQAPADGIYQRVGSARKTCWQCCSATRGTSATSCGMELGTGIVQKERRQRISQMVRNDGDDDEQ